MIPRSLRPMPGNPSTQGSAMLAITCPVCQTNISIKKDLADKKVHCPACGQLTPVPGAGQPALMGDWILTPMPDSCSHAAAPSAEVEVSHAPTDPPLGTPDATVTIGASAPSH